MLAHFGRSSYAAGTPSPDPAAVHDVDGPLTDLGRALLAEMDRLAMPLDLTHLADRSFAEALQRFQGPVCSSHTACRALVDLPRNHSDQQLRAIVERRGVIGLPLYSRFIDREAAALPFDQTPPPTSIDRLVEHVDHLCQLAGNAHHVAIGSDLDGGFGRESMPREIDSIRDLHRLGDRLQQRGYSAPDVHAIEHGNWLRFFRATLPA